MSHRLLAWLTLVLVMVGHAVAAQAGPWAAPDSPGLRQDLELLSDAGVIDIPLATWPLNWRDIRSSLNTVSEPSNLSPDVRAAWYRVRAEANRALAPKRAQLSVTAANKPRLLRFDMRNRAPNGSGARMSLQGTGQHVALNLTTSYVAQPYDGHNARLDGSYLSVNAFNWALTFGQQQRWWGPEHESSLILSNNARPVPALALQRVHTNPINLPVLRWIGPWQFRAFAGQLSTERYVSQPYLIGMRFDFKPFSRLEIGLSRTMEFGGQGRPSGLKEFGKALVGIDTNAINNKKNVANQLAGYDFRLRVWHSLSIYGQFIGEDFANYRPSKFIGMWGIDGNHAIGANGASLSWFAEYADTAVSGMFGKALYNVAYEHHIYRSGYRYYGRSLGYTTDNDASLVSLGGMLHDSAGRTWQLVARVGRLNRDGTNVAPPGGNPLASQDTNIISVDADVGLPLGRLQKLDFGLGYLHRHGHRDNYSRNDVYAYARWTRSFQL